LNDATVLFAMSREIIIAPLLDNDGALVAPAAPEQLQLSTGPYAKSVGAVLCSKLVIASTLFNAAGCVSACTLVFWLLFGVLSQGPYPWYSQNLVGVVVGSSLIACPALCMALAPAGMPEALQNGWFFCLRVEDCPPWLLYAFPYLQANRCTRIGLGRHLLLGVQLSVLFIPVALAIAAYFFPTMETWTLIWFNLVYNLILVFVAVPFGLLGFAMEHNLSRVQATMSMHPSPCERLAHRILGCLRLLC